MRETNTPEPPPPPAPAPDPDTLPRPLTIFLNAGEHRRATRALRAIHKNRARALLKALGVKPGTEARP